MGLSILNLSGKRHSPEDLPTKKEARVFIAQEAERAPVGWSGLVRRAENLLLPPEFEI